jgi:hypothetical protein
MRTARSPPKLSLKPSRLEGRVLSRDYPKRVSGLLRDCKYPVNSISSVNQVRATKSTMHLSVLAFRGLAAPAVTI